MLPFLFFLLSCGFLSKMSPIRSFPRHRLLHRDAAVVLSGSRLPKNFSDKGWDVVFAWRWHTAAAAEARMQLGQLVASFPCWRKGTGRVVCGEEGQVSRRSPRSPSPPGQFEWAELSAGHAGMCLLQTFSRACLWFFYFSARYISARVRC